MSEIQDVSAHSGWNVEKMKEPLSTKIILDKKT